MIARAVSRTQTFTYDQLNRIKTAGTPVWTQTFTDDIWGNLYNIVAAGGATGLSLGILTTNRISGDGYDLAGNMTSDGLYSYVYNAENQQTTAAGVNYTYDGDGKRVKKSNGKLYWYGMNSDALLETDLSGNLLNEYVFLAGKRSARRDSTSAVYYYLSDHLGSSRAITNSAGTLCYDADFYPYGGERVGTNTCPQNYKFTGKERDSETSGNDYFGARFYESNLGRFMSPDPGGMKVSVISNPQTWNRYTYTLNNPLRLIDPSGKFPIDAHIAWVTSGFESIGFSSGAAAAFSRTLNTTVDKSFFFADNLHAMWGDSAFYSARAALLNMAADPKSHASERAVALVLGMHLVEDRYAHIGITNLLQHFLRFLPHSDADPKSSAGDLAKEATDKFLADFKALLMKNLGEKGAEEAIGQMEQAASKVTANGAFSITRDIELSLQAREGTPGIEDQSNERISGVVREDMQQQCVLGNPAACE